MESPHKEARPARPPWPPGDPAGRYGAPEPGGNSGGGVMPDRAKDGKTGEGRRWAVMRTARGLEQQDLATGARVGAGAMSEYEQDRRSPEPATRERLLEALRCSAWDVTRT